MILKIKGNDAWTLYDNITELEHRIVSDQEALVIARHYADTDYTFPNNFDKNKTIIYITYTTKGITTSILAYQPIFVLNDTGQTVDRI